MLLVSLFIPLLTSFYIGLFGRFGIWFSIGTFNIYWTFNFSSLSWIMYFVVTNFVFNFHALYLYNLTRILILLKKTESQKI